MRIVLNSILPMGVGGQFDGRTISLSISDAKRRAPRCWRRTLLASFLHEFTHYIFSLGPWWDNPYELYKEEIVCYRVQYIAEWLMRIPHVWQWDDVYRAAEGQHSGGDQHHDG